MRNAGLEEAQAGIKIAGRNINNLRYADDTTLWQKVGNVGEHRACLPGMWQPCRQRGQGLEMQWEASRLDLGSSQGARLQDGDVVVGGRGEAER